MKIFFDNHLYCFLLIIFIVSIPQSTYAQSRNGIDYSDYLKNIQKQIKRNWHPPQSKVSKSTKVFFTIDKNGTIPSIKIYESSQDTNLDRAALAAVVNSQPFPLPPQGKNISVQYTFDYKAHSLPKTEESQSAQGILDSMFSKDKNPQKRDGNFIWFVAPFFILLIMLRNFAKTSREYKNKEEVLANSQSLIEKDESHDSILD